MFSKLLCGGIKWIKKQSSLLHTRYLDREGGGRTQQSFQIQYYSSNFVCVCVCFQSVTAMVRQRSATLIRQYPTCHSAWTSMVKTEGVASALAAVITQPESTVKHAWLDSTDLLGYVTHACTCAVFAIRHD